MKNATLFACALSALIFVSCDKETIDAPFAIAGITMENYPKVDGSTTTIGLQNLIACKLLGYKYGWVDDIFLDGANTKNTLSYRLYHYTTEVYAVIRSDLDKTSMAHKIYDLLLSEAGSKIIKESGYIPY
jgi:hypothetical protein